MIDKHLQHLAKELGGGKLPELGALGAGDIDNLTAKLREARRRQKAAIDRAFSDALGHIPFILRGAVRKLLSP